MREYEGDFIQACKDAFGAENVNVVDTPNQALAEIAKREARRQYQREWRMNNPDKVKAQRERYWEKKGKELVGQTAISNIKAPKTNDWRWISVTDMLPRHGQNVIFMSDSSGNSPRYMNIHWGWFAINKNGKWGFYIKDHEDVENVLYWLPEPEFPTEGD